MQPLPGIQSLCELSTRSETVFPARRVRLPAILAFTNAPADRQQSWQAAYEARVADPGAVSLERLPSGTLVSGRHFAAVADGIAVQEQFRHDIHGEPDLLNAELTGQPIADIDGDVLMIARYGEGTWGHWLVELLPKLAVAERTWPGRFRFTMPRRVLSDKSLKDRIVESTSAYGVGPERYVVLTDEVTYRFSSLYGLTRVWADFALHPDVAALLDAGIGTAPATERQPARVALVRADSRRGIQNADAINDLLRHARFELIDIARSSFAEQVALFRSAKTVFSVLGSGLSGLIYAAAGTRVLAAAPERFGDRFFYNILQSKPGAFWAEARGPVDEQHPTLYRDASFRLAPADVEAAMSALGV